MKDVSRKVVTGPQNKTEKEIAEKARITRAYLYSEYLEKYNYLKKEIIPELARYICLEETMRIVLDGKLSRPSRTYLVRWFNICHELQNYYYSFYLYRNALPITMRMNVDDILRDAKNNYTLTYKDKAKILEHVGSYYRSVNNYNVFYSCLGDDERLYVKIKGGSYGNKDCKNSEDSVCELRGFNGDLDRHKSTEDSTSRWLRQHNRK